MNTPPLSQPGPIAPALSHYLPDAREVLHG